MKLVIIRHGEAGKATSDELRELTDKGRAEAGRLAKAMGRTDFKGAEIWHSGFVRAEQTAQILAAELRLEYAMSVHPMLEPMGDPLAVMEGLVGRTKDLILVGHMPFMGKMASQLLGREGQPSLDFATGSAACFRPPVIEGAGWRLMWHMDPDLLE